MINRLCGPAQKFLHLSYLLRSLPNFLLQQPLYPASRHPANEAFADQHFYIHLGPWGQ